MHFPEVLLKRLRVRRKLRKIRIPILRSQMYCVNTVKYTVVLSTYINSNNFKCCSCEERWKISIITY